MKHLEQLNVQSFIGCETSALFSGSLLQLLWLLLTSWLIEQIYFRISPGKVNSLLITPAASTYLRFLKLFGLRNDVLTHPHRYASYAVPVRQGNLLQSGLLQCMDYSKPPCRLGGTNASGTLPPYIRDLHSLASLKNYIYHSGHTQGAFCYAGWRIYPHRHIAIICSPGWTNNSQQKNITSTSVFQSTSVPAEGSQTISTAESPDVGCNA